MKKDCFYDDIITSKVVIKNKQLGYGYTIHSHESNAIISLSKNNNIFISCVKKNVKMRLNTQKVTTYFLYPSSQSQLLFNRTVSNGLFQYSTQADFKQLLYTLIGI